MPWVSTQRDYACTPKPPLICLLNQEAAIDSRKAILVVKRNVPRRTAKRLKEPTRECNVPYIFDENENLERQRLLGLTYERPTIQLLDAANLSPGVRCLDVGCGIGEATRLLAKRSGVHGEVEGLDTDGSLLEVARTIPTVGARVTYSEGDAGKLPFEDASFGFVFARSLFQHLPEPERALSEMVRVCGRGGVVAVQDADLSRHYSFPENYAISRITGLWAAMIPDPVLGPKLWGLFDSLGLSPISIAIDLLRARHESAALKRLYLLSFESTRALLVEREMIEESEADDLLAECKRLELDQNAVCLGPLNYTAWAIKE